tara:strand:- start:2060 stop:2260 length:201 start_codon:yes stop_codon:yes gene_type:complete
MNIEILVTLTGFRATVWECPKRIKALATEHFSVFPSGESLKESADKAYENAVIWANQKALQLKEKK